MADHKPKRIVRIKHKGNFTILDNGVLTDKNRSWEARAIWGYLMTKPDNWMIRVNDLVLNGPAGRHKIQRVLKELGAAGLIRRVRTVGADGTIHWESTVYEVSIFDEARRGELLGLDSAAGSEAAQDEEGDEPSSD